MKTILFIVMILTNNSFCEEYQNKNLIPIQESRPISKYESPEEIEAKIIRQKTEADDVKLNKKEIQEGKYWVNGQWVERKNENYKRVNGGWVYQEPSIEKASGELRNELEKEEIIHTKKYKNIATFSMEGCEAGFHFPETKDVLPIATLHKVIKALNDLK